MKNLLSLEPIDYLVIGHVAKDIIPQGFRIGGTVSYSSLTARALGMRVGIVTSCTEDLPLTELVGIPVVVIDTKHNTTFENINTDHGRIQYLHSQATPLKFSHIPAAWRDTPVIHLGPLAQEVDPEMAGHFPNSMVGLTPQGWLRAWDGDKRVHYTEWPHATRILEKASVAIISVEDVQGDENRIEEMAAAIDLLAVTEGCYGSRLYWKGDLRRFQAPPIKEIDPTGAGDIFAACFFFRLWSTKDPWEAARFATHLASFSVTRYGLQGVPTQEEIQTCLVEVLPK